MQPRLIMQCLNLVLQQEIFDQKVTLKIVAFIHPLVWGEHIYQNQDFKIWLWPQNPEIESMKFVYEKNFWNGISITKTSDNSLESWCFASDRSSTQMQNFSQKNMS